jgi:hypothetical protein
VVKQVAEAEKYDAILQEAVYINPKHDITDKVIKALNAVGERLPQASSAWAICVVLRSEPSLTALGGELHRPGTRIERWRRCRVPGPMR